MKSSCLLLALLLFKLNIHCQSFTSSNLPLVIINTNGQEIPDDPKITASMGIIANGANQRNAITDNYNQYNGTIGIELRGQSSQQFPLKSYSIELRDNTGKSIEQSLFGLPKESDWILYAPYNDKTLMRNFLAYTMSREMGRWAANCRYVELILNGEYRGIYVFMERIKRGSGRVNITKLNSTDINGDAVTGGYIFSIDKEADGWFSNYKPLNSTNNQTIQFSYIYPKASSITSAQSSYLKNFVDSFELALQNAETKNYPLNWRNFADENSFIDYLIINEISRNIDGYRLSSYFHKDRNSKDGRIKAGPVWDYDLAFRNANYCTGSGYAGWIYDSFNKTCPKDYWQIPFWWDVITKDVRFKSLLRCRWKELRQTSLSWARINTLIDSVATLTTEARGRHFAKWPVLGQYVWPNPTPIASNYSDELLYLKEWIENRIKWMDANMPNEGDCFDYPNDASNGIQLSLSPNPMQEEGSILLKLRTNGVIHLRILDYNGRIVYQATKDALNYNRFSLSVTHLQKGTYVLQAISSNGEQAQQKFIKQ